MKLTYAIIYGCFLNVAVFAQNKEADIKTILDKVAKVYSTPNYSFNMKYELFKNSTESTVKEYYTGKTIKEGDQYYSKIHNTETIQLSNRFLKINHDEKAILYSEEALPTNTNPLAEIATLFNYFDKTNIKEESHVYICEFIAKERSVLPYSKAILFINKLDYTILKQVLYLASQNSTTDKDGNVKLSNPRLEISFSNFSTKDTNTSQVFSLVKYVTINKDIVKPSSKLMAYQVINASKPM